MSLLSFRQSLIDTFELRVLLDLGDGAVQGRTVAFVLPVRHILGHFVGVSHPSPPKCAPKITPSAAAQLPRNGATSPARAPSSDQVPPPTIIKVIAIPITNKWYSNPSPVWLPYQFMNKPY